MDTLPVDITELQLGIAIRANEATRPLSRKRVPTAPLNEMWAGQVACAAKSTADHRALLAAIEARDGRAGVFGLALKSGFASLGPDITAALGAVPAIGAQTITVTFAAPVDVAPGTLCTVGNIDAGPYQLFEIVAAASGSGPVVLSIAPRVRYTFAAGAVVKLGSVVGKFSLASDVPDQSATLDRGTVTLDIIEAL